MKLLTILAFLAFIFPFGCVDYSNFTAPAGTFQYSAYDNAMNLVAYGWLTINDKDSSDIVGDWKIAAVGDVAHLGPQIGDGKSHGSFQKSKLYLNLNPTVVDDNVILVGSYDGRTFKGNWGWSSFAGLTDKGFFVAVRK